MNKIEEMKQKYDAIPVPENLKEKVIKSMEEGKRAGNRRMLPLIKVMGVVAAAMIALVVTINLNPVMARTMEKIPILGTVVRVVNFTTYSDKQEKKQMEAKVKVPKVKVIGKDGSVLTKESKELNATVSGYLDKIIRQYQKDVAAVADDGKGREAVSSDYRIVTDNDRLFSLRVDTVIAMAGSDSYTRIFTIDKATGKRITLKQLFVKHSNYISRISDNIKKQMREQMKKDQSITYFLDDGQTEWDFDKISAKANFYVNDQGELTIVFDKYEVAPGYMGMVEFSIPTKEISDILVKGNLQ